MRSIGPIFVLSTLIAAALPVESLWAQSSGNITETVNQRGTIGVLTASPNSGLATGTTINFSYMLETAGAPAPTSETVQFYDGGTAIGSAQSITSTAGSNLLPYSQIDTTQGWTTVGTTGPTVTVNSATGPDGVASSATQVVFPDTTSTFSGVTYAVPGTAYASLSMTLSVWAKSASPTVLTLLLKDSPAVTATQSTTCAVTSTWQRCTLTYVFPANAGTGFSATLSSAGQPPQTINLWGAQVEQAAAAGPYVSTIGTARPTGGQGGPVSWSYAGLLTGSHSITAVYGGDANFLSSTSNALALTVGKDAPAIALSSSPVSTSAYGASVTFTANLAAPSTEPTYIPTGTVQFFDGVTALGGAQTINGSGNATLTLVGATALLAGTHSITAVYSGDSNFSTVTSSVETYTVTKASGAITVSPVSSLNPSRYGDAVTFTITLTSTFSAIPTGTVSISDSGTVLGTPTINGSGVATFTMNLFTAGAHNLTITYSGDGNYN
jgi:hypothetical protein